jgi:hypothetical protein
LGGEACAIAFIEKHIADRIIKSLIIISLRLQPYLGKPPDGLRDVFIVFRSRAIAIFIFKARARTEDLLRSIRVAISNRLKPNSARFRGRSSSAGDHGTKVISSPSVPALQAGGPHAHEH